MGENIELTARKELQELLRLEFHSGDGKYDPTELRNYLKRLTKNQNLLLKSSKAKPGRITAFVVFGDGMIDQPIGGTNDYPKEEIFQHILRPNASLALFYKDKSGHLELAFYTRFLEVYYLRPGAAEIKDLCKKLDNFQDVERTRQALFGAMAKGLPALGAFLPATAMPAEKQRYYFYINSHTPEGQYAAAIPWIRLFNAQRKEPECIGAGNAIHGTINTKGCWMLLRNFLWKWPHENDGRVYTDMMKCYLEYRQNVDFSLQIAEKVKKILGLNVAPTVTQAFFEPKNYAYFYFLRLFTGMHFTEYVDGMRYPSWRHRRLDDPNNTKLGFKTDLNETVKDFWKGETIYFKGGNLDKMTATAAGYDGNTKMIKLAPPGLAIEPWSGVQFELDNSWCVAPAPVWGWNVFGQRFGFKQAWADVFVFKRTDRFTARTGDQQPFQ